MRRVSGYNLDEFVRNGKFNLVKLIVGSEGTLAAVHQAKVRIEPRPPATALCVVHFADIVESIRASDIILPFNPSAIELIDDMIIDLGRNSLEISRLMGFIEGNPAALLLVEFYGENEAELRSKLDSMEAALKREKAGYAYVRAFDPAEQQSIWKVRKAGLGLLLGMKGERKPIAFVEDCAVEPSKLPEFFVRFRDVIHKYDTSAGYYGHASVGCLHIRPLINTKDRRDIQVMKDMTDEIADLVIEFGGGMSGEHGDGLARSHLNEKLFGPQIYKAFRDVKDAFDPENRMNPGKIVNAPPMTENLRYGTEYHTIPINTHYDFSREGGFATAVELCNGAGVCRKKNEGTMCPSYMVTLEDKHSTRGRANLMREILSGKLPADEFTGKDLYETLDLCLECKGCKAECPSNVDMAKLKYEFLAHYNEANGTPLRSKMFANIHAASKVASLWPSLANRMLSSTMVRRALDPFVGIDARRKLPVVCSRNVRILVRKAAENERWRRNKRSYRKGRSLPRYVHQLQLSRHRQGGNPTAGSGGIRSPHCGTAEMLRPADDLERPARRSASECRIQCSTALRIRRDGLLDRRLRAQLHSDIPRRISGSRQRPPCGGCRQGVVPSRRIHREGKAGRPLETCSSSGRSRRR